MTTQTTFRKDQRLDVNLPFRRLILGILTLLLILGMGTSLNLAQENSDTAAIARIDEGLARMAQNGSFSGAVLIARDGQILLEKGYGFAVREFQVPNTAETRFFIGPISDQFTSMSILMLQEQGLLNVEDKLCSYIEDCPESWADISIRDLLMHTSGIPNIKELLEWRELQLHALTPIETIGHFRDLPLVFEPGSAWSYSFSNYIVLVHILETVHGSSYRSVISENIFEPLGMEHSGFAGNTSIVESLAQPYSNVRARAAFRDVNMPHAAYAMYSTVGDLYLWQQALMSGQLVSRENWDAMLANAHHFPDMANVAYAYGLILNNNPDHPWVGESGFSDGYAGLLAYFTEDNLAFIRLENLENQPWYYIEQFPRLYFGS